jgi:bifunctional ADP-heptose synthase (sugar kinase/adenylyltransferase)
LVEAAVVANAAAGITIGEVGTASVTPGQLKRELRLNIKNGNLIIATSGT